MKCVVKAENLTKIYSTKIKKKGSSLFSKKEEKTIEALKNVDFSIEEGGVVGLIGANGAGKSTAIKIITGILHPTRGQAFLFGKDPLKNRKENAFKIGLMMGQRSQLWWDLPVRDSFELYRRMYGVSIEDGKQMIGILDELLEIESFMSQPVRKLSLGQRMRCELGVTLLHRPSLLFLDEPTIGIDILTKEKIMSFIQKINQEWGTTIILTTHDIADIEKASKNIMVIHKGDLIFNGATEQLKKYVTTCEVEVEFQQPVDLLSIPKVTLCQHSPNKITLTFEKDEVSISSLMSHVLNTYPVVDISIKTPGIENVVKKLYAEEMVGGWV